jgi:glycosyltransferase involved in cell wall biosynthesis
MTHRKHGFIVPDLHAVAIADAVREIMSDQTLYRTLSSGAVEFFKRRLSWAKSGRLLLDFYLSRAIEAGTGPVIAGDTVSTNALRRLS